MDDLPTLDEALPVALRAVMALHGFNVYHSRVNKRYFEVERGATKVAFYCRFGGTWRFYAQYVTDTPELIGSEAGYPIESTRRFVRLLTGVDV